MCAMFKNKPPENSNVLCFRNKFSEITDINKIKTIIDKACYYKKPDDINTVDINGNDFGTNITFKDFNNMLDHIAKIFPKLHKLTLCENNLHKWFESKNEITVDINLNFMSNLKSIDISQNGLFLCGMSHKTLSMVLKSFPEDLKTLDLAQYCDHPTSDNYKYTEKELIDIVSIAEKHFKSIEKMFFEEKLESDLELDGTFKALKSFVIHSQSTEKEKLKI